MVMTSPREQTDPAEIVDLLVHARAGGQDHGMRRVHGALARNDRGSPLNTTGNLLTILAHDPPLAGMLGYDEFIAQPLMLRAAPPPDVNESPLPGPYPRPWGPEDVGLVHAYVQRTWITRAGRDAIEQAMVTEAAHRRFHPVRDWLASLTWDSAPRLDRWLVHAFGCSDDDYHAAIAAKFLIAAVRRVRRPGCKFDHMPVLEGSQGIGKSSALRELFGSAWFSDAMPDELAARDAALALRGVWGVEFAEIQHLIRSEVEVIKAFLSRSVDRYREPYGKAFVDRPRQGVLIGTTNATDYLRDTSGNRRIWPIRCAHADVEWVATNREQLWAEAAAREAADEAIWLHEFDVRATAERLQADRMPEDVWTDDVRDWLVGKTQVRIADILANVLLVPKERQGRREELRVAGILSALGWQRTVVRQLYGRVTRVWVAGQ